MYMGRKEPIDEAYVVHKKQTEADAKNPGRDADPIACFLAC